MDKIEILLKTGKTIFGIRDLRLFWDESNPDALKSSIQYYVNQQKLFRLKRGVYSLSLNFDPFEVAQTLISPSYLTLQSALLHYGIIFQQTNSITSFALYFRTFQIHSQTYTYHAVKEDVLFNPLGIGKIGSVSIASPERAVADTLYLLGEFYFDNLKPVNPDKLSKIASVYKKKAVEKRIQSLLLTF